MSDASRLAEELRTEHEHSGAVERGAKATFAQCNELQARLEEMAAGLSWAPSEMARGNSDLAAPCCNKVTSSTSST